MWPPADVAAGNQTGCFTGMEARQIRSPGSKEILQSIKDKYITTLSYEPYPELTMSENSFQSKTTLVPLASRLTHKFYEPVMLLSSLMGLTRDAAVTRFSETSINIQNDKEVFQAFVNKLSHVCDSMIGGSTVTAFTVLRNEHNDGFVNYYFAVNRRSHKELRDTASYVEGLLRRVNRLVGGHEDVDDVRKELLRDVLNFNRSRLMVYLRALRLQVEECLTRCRVDMNDKDRLLIRKLSTLQKLVDAGNFSGGINTECALVHKIRYELTLTCHTPKLEQSSGSAQFEAGCPKCGGVQCWSELLHTTKRILAYPQSVKFFLLARQRWPTLFHNPNVSFVPSSTPTRISVRNKSLTAESIVGRMTSERAKIETFRNYAQALQAFHLNDRIEFEYGKVSFAPIVHAEILLFNYLEINGGVESSRFFMDWNYIGGSKPTCRLCDYYFQEHRKPVEHRSSHGNLYRSWRFPDVLDYQPSSALVARQEMFDKVLQLVRQDAFDLMTQRVPPSYKDHDSNTFTASMTLESHWALKGTNAEMDEVASVLGSANLSEAGEKGSEYDDSDGGVAI